MNDDATQLAACAEAGLDRRRLPRHVAVIMDGNGRWAKRHGWRRWRGHKQGVESVRTVITASARLGMEHLTLYSFSSENWQRPAAEVDFLMRLLGDTVTAELPVFHEHGVCLRAIGELDRLPEHLQDQLRVACAETAAYHQGLQVHLALSYGGRDELVRACRLIAARVASGELAPAAITSADIQAALYAPDAPDVDLVIRTAGEQRLSNFLPWQSVYAEYVSSPVFWPAFGLADYQAALRTYQERERRFGSVSMEAVTSHSAD